MVRSEAMSFMFGLFGLSLYRRSGPTYTCAIGTVHGSLRLQREQTTGPICACRLVLTSLVENPVRNSFRLTISVINIHVGLTPLM